MKPWLMGAVGRVYSTLEVRCTPGVPLYDNMGFKSAAHSTQPVPYNGRSSRLW